MYKLSQTLWIILCVGILSGCAASPINLDARMVAPNSTGVYSDDNVNISYQFQPRWFHVNRSFATARGFYVIGIDLKITNNSSNPLKILWNESSLVMNGQNMRVVHKGFKFRQKDQPQVPTVVPAKGTISDMVVPADHISFDPSIAMWIYDPLINDDQQNRIRVDLTYEIENVKKTADVEFVVIKKEAPRPSAMPTNY